MEQTNNIPRAFLLRRLHSFTGFFFMLYLIEHLFVNSQLALIAEGTAFIDSVKAIHALPYLNFIEIVLLGVPIATHAILGIRYLLQARPNSYASDGSLPALPEYARNQAYTWQRITSWILLLAVFGHVVHMRFIEYPASARRGPINPETALSYMVRVDADPHLPSLAKQLGVQLYSQQDIEAYKASIQAAPSAQHTQWLAALEKKPIQAHQFTAVAPNFGTATLLMLRETFKMPLMVALYTIFVLSACFHAFNGLSTFLITWGITITSKAQKNGAYVCSFLMGLIAFLGLSTIFGSYWINLKG